VQDLNGRVVSAIVALAGACLLLPEAASAANRSFIVTDFDSIRVEAPIAVAVATRRGVTARGEGDAAMLDRIELRVSGRILTVRLKASPFEGSHDNGSGAPLRLFLTVPALRSAQLAGSGMLAVQGMRGERAEIVAAGSGSLVVTDIASGTLAVGQMGAGQLRLSGKAGTAIMRLTGSGEVNATGLDVADLDITAEGSGTAQALATRSARIVAIGPANIQVDGQPACTVRHAGSGTVMCGDKRF
jgi:hypothetical protein